MGPTRLPSWRERRIPRAAVRALAPAFAVALAACAGPAKSPAPVVVRVPGATTESPRPPAPRVDIPLGSGASRVPLPSPDAPGATPSGSPPPSAAGPAPAVGAPQAGGESSQPTVEAAPIRSGRVESRPLGGGTIALPSQAPSGSGDASAVRTTPDGMKKPYSEAALAAMRAQSSGPAAPAAADGASAAPASPAASSRTPLPAAAGASRPFAWPASGRIVSRFSDAKANDARSMGIAIEGKPGDPVVAAADGKVIFSGVGPKGYGQLLIVKHADELLSVYAHNRALLVKEGQSVRRGQRIAELGATGTSTPQLHFEVRRQGKPIDPLTMLPER